MVHCETSQSKSVCVIGAGPSGLVTARELRKEGHKVVVLEQNHDVGGQWLYDPNVEKEDPLGKRPFLKVHSSIHESLRLQSPREIMGFTDFPFLVKKGRDMRRFPGHKELLLYIKDFCDFFGLREMIRFNTRVDYVGLVSQHCNNNNNNGVICGNDLMKWVVRSRENKKNDDDDDDVKEVEEVFDAVVVATGHYAQPRLPSIKGMDSWKRKQLHSHIYRTPESFRNEIVVVVGNSISAQDISVELSSVAKEVHISYRSQNMSSEGFSRVISKHQNMHLRPQIDTLEEDGWVKFMNGTCIIADTIVYCTGYSYAFPFLDTKGIVNVDDNRVSPLYEHTFPPSLAPSLSFVGIPRKIIGFPFFESQAIWIAQVLSGKKALPSWDEMMKCIEEFYHSRDAAGVPKCNTHDIIEFEYCDKYGDFVGFPHLEEWRKKLCVSNIISSTVNIETFRDSWDDEVNELLREALQSPHFTQYGVQHQDSTL